MTVKELIEKLQAIPGDRLVVMSKDAEGNEYSPLDDVRGGYYRAETTWTGDFTSRPEDAEEMGAKQEVVCLWPTN